MLDIPRPEHRFHTDPATWIKDANGRRLRTVDLHAHLITLAVEQLVAECPQKKSEPEVRLRTMGRASVEHNTQVMLPGCAAALTDLGVRLADMDTMGVDVQVVSPSPTQYYYWADPDLAARIVSLQNEHVAEFCAQSPERLVGLGTLALQHPQLAVAQLVHAVDKLGLRGFELSTAVNDRELSHPSLEPVWAKAQELGCVVFIHPLGCSLGERLTLAYLSNSVGQPVETAVALSHVIFGGVLDRYPNLKICAAHGGGYLPTYIGRADHAFHTRPDARTMSQPPSAYLRRMWFDTLVYSPEALRKLIDQVGAGQVVVGTDYPFDMGHYDIHAVIGNTPGLSHAEREAILGGNAAALLRK
ncbi:MAG TPA: amidohydrolase family protein [Steroidobacteraceae bacterium]|nr:amidohydrolase family protein [Steroidobacteraceae bacterium]